MVLLHSQGRGCLFETATPTFMTKFRSYLIGLSNGVLFISLSCGFKRFFKTTPVFGLYKAGPPVTTRAATEESSHPESASRLLLPTARVWAGTGDIPRGWCSSLLKRYKEVRVDDYNVPGVSQFGAVPPGAKACSQGEQSRGSPKGLLPTISLSEGNMHFF